MTALYHAANKCNDSTFLTGLVGWHFHCSIKPECSRKLWLDSSSYCGPVWEPHHHRHLLSSRKLCVKKNAATKHIPEMWKKTKPKAFSMRELWGKLGALNKEITGRVFLFVTCNHSVKVCLLSKINYWRFPKYSDSPSLCSLHSKTQFHKKWYLLSQSVRKRLTVACNFLFLASFFLLAECLIVNTRVSVFSWTAEQVS